ncbi:hypothetical protein [Glaciihabitans sp. dw_435]|uniref:hypothetical protein n=1 Tax=Glaciihabitans sp. dw_435 TaxID=2720081 RepID=UPI001BD46E41|nr:hypothetical protein [Glaciihabitans sp. dw_435]
MIIVPKKLDSAAVGYPLDLDKGVFRNLTVDFKNPEELVTLSFGSSVTFDGTVAELQTILAAARVTP